MVLSALVIVGFGMSICGRYTVEDGIWYEPGGERHCVVRREEKKKVVLHLTESSGKRTPGNQTRIPGGVALDGKIPVSIYLQE